MSHPNRLLSDRELHNFKTFLVANPHLTRPAPQGAFDAMPRNVRRVPGKPIKTPLKAFGKGGKFDTARYAMDAEPDDVVSPGEAGMAFVRDLAMKLSPEGWAALREACIEGQEAAEDDPPEFEGKPEVGGERAEDRALSGFASRFADAARVTVSAPVYRKPKKQKPAMDGKKADSFAARFPGAAAVRVGG
ncbi:hypothetical protein QA646_17805 [Rhizobium sp. CB3090]|uniref:hypothetical protein n=1 Tax=Rhizobium sp. CB3090 TaxID=3039156 RepID=UPI0024B21AF8|nr:hypothetical protein [Rhizobium sp. CB3090]WFU09101.1 hypothetical protein QA646_17805 [Rhizobium sp. CB3090]